MDENKNTYATNHTMPPIPSHSDMEEYSMPPNPPPSESNLQGLNESSNMLASVSSEPVSDNDIIGVQPQGEQETEHHPGRIEKNQLDSVKEDEGQEDNGPLDDGGGGERPNEVGKEGKKPSESASEEEREDEEELIVLDPEHPLMRRFQTALKTQLQNQKERLVLELQELTENLRIRKKEREDVGVLLYGVQQEVGRQQAILEQCHDSINTFIQERTEKEEQLKIFQCQHKEMIDKVNHSRKKEMELHQEIKNLLARQYTLQSSQHNMEKEITVTQRATEKLQREMAKGAVEKQMQDLLIDRLVVDVKQLEEQVALYITQAQAQHSECQSTRQVIREAITEIDALSVEKRQLLHAWNNSLVSMQRRDEAYSTVQNAYRVHQQSLHSVELEIEGCKKDIEKELENNERLTLLKNRLDGDIFIMMRLTNKSISEQEALKLQLASYNRLLSETTQNLQDVSEECSVREKEIQKQVWDIEKEYQEKVKLEDLVLETMRKQLTLDKACQYTEKNTTKVRNMTKQQELELARAENVLSKLVMDLTHHSSTLSQKQHYLQELKVEISHQEEAMSSQKQEFKRKHGYIQKKQTVIEQLKKKVEELLTSAGGVELAPLELKVKSMEKSIEEMMGECSKQQQYWLRLQRELVQLARRRDEQVQGLDTLQKELMVLEQKKIRMEAEIQSRSTEVCKIQKSIQKLQHSLIHFNSLLHQERGLKETLEQENLLAQNKFISSLKEAELGALNLQSEINRLAEETQRLTNSLIEAQEQGLLWEKKIQLAREAKALLDKEMSQDGEIQHMKGEIHRMQVRFSQLMRMQERMIQDMERSVSRRETIVMQADAVQKKGTKSKSPNQTKVAFQRKLEDLKSKIKKKQKDTVYVEQSISETRMKQAELKEQLAVKQQQLKQLETLGQELEDRRVCGLSHKQKNLEILVLKQQRARYYQLVKDGKYRKVCKDGDNLDAEVTKQQAENNKITEIISKLVLDFPRTAPSFSRIKVALESSSI